MGTVSTVISRSAATAINHVLSNAQWAQKALREHAGKRARLSISGLETSFTIEENGMVKAAGAEAQPDVTIQMPILDALRLAHGDPSARQAAKVEGDSRLAADIWRLAAELKWDVEEDLSRLTGDIVAHRLVSTARSFNAWIRDSALRVESAYGEYATEEAKLLPPRAEVDHWLRDVDTLRDDVERLEQRIARLESGHR